MITLPPEAAEYTRFILAEKAQALREDARKTRQRGAGNVMQRPSFSYIADAMDRAARELEAARNEVRGHQAAPVPSVQSEGDPS